MAQSNSNQDSDGIVWGTTALRLGSDGMDLRLPTEPSSLADLINARFLDERTIQRRDGHFGQELRDGTGFPASVDVAAGQWIYGHGQTVDDKNTTYPIHLHGGVTFRLSDTDVVWTGDRLFVSQSGGNPAIGSSTFWQRADDIAVGDALNKQYQRGVPAFIPLESDLLAPAPITGDWVESCITSSLRVYCYIANNKVFAATLNRATGLVVDVSEITGTSTTPAEPSVLSSGDIPVILFRDTTDLSFRIHFWTGTGWTIEGEFATAESYDAVPTNDGIKLLWRDSSVLRTAQYVGRIAQAPFAAALTTSATPNGVVALSVASDGVFGAAYATAGGLVFDEFTSSGTSSGYSLAPQASLTPSSGLSLSVRGLKNQGDGWEWIMYSSDSGLVTIESFSAYATSIGIGYAGFTTAKRYNSKLIARSFVVGDEVFCWLKSTNADTAYLVAGATHPLIAGYADREVAITPKTPGMGDTFVYWPARTVKDPADASELSWTWTRKFDTGVSSRTGDVISGNMNFLPHPSVAIYGKSAYMSGSAVKNYDGVDLEDAGYQDFPVVSSSFPSAGTGHLTFGGQYQYIIRAVRYNTQGERLESAELTYVAPQLTGIQNTLALTINTVPSITGPASSPDDNDVTLEVYRNVDTGSAFYLEGTVAHTTGAATVQFISGIFTDTDLIKQKADPHQTGTGNEKEIESWGPIGCSVLVTVGDRLWGAGGQVPSGQVQFSKLKNVGFAAGFDDLAGYIQVDNENGLITSLAGQNGALVVFEASRAYVYSNNGPDNFGNGAFGVPQLVLAAGALNHFGTGLCQLGVLYYGIEGPLLLDQSFTVQNISSPVRPLTETLVPTGMRVDTSRMEVVWYCGVNAVIWNYMGGTSRWGRWTTPDVVSVYNTQLLTATGRLLTEDATAPGDDGVPYGFTFKTGDIRPEALREGSAMIRRVGITGEHLGPHTLRMRVYFDGSPLWSEESIWHPETDTWLTEGTDYMSMTPTAIDALDTVDRSGSYGTNKRLRRETCNYISIEISDQSSLYQTFIPFELAFEMGIKPGLGRVAVNTFTGQNR